VNAPRKKTAFRKHDCLLESQLADARANSSREAKVAAFIGETPGRTAEKWKQYANPGGPSISAESDSANDGTPPGNKTILGVAAATNTQSVQASMGGGGYAVAPPPTLEDRASRDAPQTQILQ